MQQTPGCRLRFRYRLRDRAHPARGHTRRHQDLFPFSGGPLGEDCRKLDTQRRRVGPPGRRFGIALVGHEIRPAEGAAQFTELPFLVGGEGEQPILGREHAGRRAAACRDIAGGHRDGPGVHMLRNYRAHHGEGAVAHRNVDALERAGPVAGGERRHNREGGIDAGDVVDDRRTDAKRCALWRAGHRHQSGHGLDYVVVGRPRRERAILTEPRDRSEDQPRIERP